MESETLSSVTRQSRVFHPDALNRRLPAVQLLRGADLSAMLTTAGAGYLRFRDKAVTRWRPDPTSDLDGSFLYLRDLASGKFWSVTYQPTSLEPAEYQHEFGAGAVRFTRLQEGLKSELEVFLAATDNVELRRLTLTNQSDQLRQIEVTTYAEIALHDPLADLSHLAYSKLFVETSQDSLGRLFAHRRPRLNGEVTLAACHFLAEGPDGSKLAYETDRASFLGRGNTIAAPQAMLSGDCLPGKLGSVLDPIFSLRTVANLEPGQSVCLTFGMAVAEQLAELPALANRYQSVAEVARAWQAAQSAAADTSPIPSAAKIFCLSADDEDVSQVNGHRGLSGPHWQEDASTNGEVGANSTYYQPATSAGSPSCGAEEELLLDNGLGGFSADGTEYVIRIRPASDGRATLPPMPWVNIIANEQAGFIVSETGAGCTWAGNSRLNRLTPWQNDPISDTHGEAIFIRDEDSLTYWTPTPGPVRQTCDYEVRHGFGYTIFQHTSNDLAHELTQFVPVDEAIKMTWVRLKNLSNRPRDLSLLSYQQWDLCDGNPHVKAHTITEIEKQTGAIFATNDRRGVFSQNCAFAALVPPVGAAIESTSDRFEFLGSHGSIAAPRSVVQDLPLQGREGTGFDQCAASRTRVQLQPGESIEFAVLLGEAESRDAARDMLQRYSSPESWATALSEVQIAWQRTLSAVQIETPSTELNLMVNGWLAYQNISCRYWGRTSLYQSGGAYGYRDQLQDAAALLHLRPDFTRQQILRNAAHQFVEGDVMHWWHPPESVGIRTVFSDDLLWLPLFAAEYVAATGDESLWDEQTRFLSGRQVPAGEPEVYFVPDDSGEQGSVYDHCCRALDRGLTRGEHGLPLMGCGDWNDGMNRVGLGGTGESVWLGFFIDSILQGMLPVCRQRGDSERLARYEEYQAQLREALHEAGWDGGWYRRAYFDDGTPLGTAEADECQIDALVQAWAVLSGADTPERAEKAMEAAAGRLVDEGAGIIQLLDPPFDKMANDPGYIKGYLPGVRENGGQYTHGVLWFVRAVAEMGYGSRAVQLLEMLTPVSHTRTPELVSVYQTEPYVVAADVYSQDHAGRGGWSWYTGSAGWMWRVAVESILGLRLEGGKTLRIDPRISTAWPECKVRYRLDDGQTTYEITLLNPDAKEQGIIECQLDGEPLAVTDGLARVPLARDGATHQVIVGL